MASTKTGLLITTARKTGRSEGEIAKMIYRLLAEGSIKNEKTPAKCLVLESASAALPENILTSIMDDVDKKKAYRLSVMDQFVKLLADFEGSAQLHQEIGLYLGVEKASLGCIYEALSGDWVRSKSEVIIANLLHERGVRFRYEARIRLDDMELKPDFAIESDGQTIYWEHLGLLSRQDYREDWARKGRAYQKHLPNQLITTIESPFLSRDAEAIIQARFPSVKPAGSLDATA